MSSPTGVVVGSVVVITGTTMLRLYSQPVKAGAKSPYTPLIFGFLLLIALLAISIAAPGLAKGLALLGLVGAFVVNGPAVFAVVSKVSQ